MASSTEAVSTPAIADHAVRAALLLGALGVVFGDIGTSPIYAFRESLKAIEAASFLLVGAQSATAADDEYVVSPTRKEY